MRKHSKELEGWSLAERECFAVVVAIPMFSMKHTKQRIAKGVSKIQRLAATGIVPMDHEFKIGSFRKVAQSLKREGLCSAKTVDKILRFHDANINSSIDRWYMCHNMHAQVRASVLQVRASVL